MLTTTDPVSEAKARVRERVAKSDLIEINGETFASPRLRYPGQVTSETLRAQRELRYGPSGVYYKVCMRRHRVFEDREILLKDGTTINVGRGVGWTDHPQTQNGVIPFFQAYPYMAGWL